MMKKVLLLLCLTIIFSGYNEPLDSTTNAPFHSNKGIYYMRLQQWNSAIQEFKIAIALNPNSPANSTYYNNLGVIYNKIGKHAWAQEAYEQAIKRNPIFLEYYIGLVDTYGYMGTLKSHLAEYKKLTDKDSMNSYAWLMKGLIYNKMCDKKHAYESLKIFTIIESQEILRNAVFKLMEEINPNPES